jgi:hypothetical protein
MSKSIILLTFLITITFLFTGCGGATSPSNYINITEYDDTVEFRGLTSYFPTKSTTMKVPNYPRSTITVSPILNADKKRSHIILRLNKKDYLKNIEDSKYWPEKGLPSGENLPAKLGDGVGNGFTLPGIQIDQYDNGKIVIYQKNRKFGIFVPEKQVFNVKDILTFSWKNNNYRFKASIIGKNNKRHESGVVLLFPEI